MRKGQKLVQALFKEWFSNFKDPQSTHVRIQRKWFSEYFTNSIAKISDEELDRILSKT